MNTSTSYLFKCYGLGLLKYSAEREFPNLRCIGTRGFHPQVLEMPVSEKGPVQQERQNLDVVRQEKNENEQREDQASLSFSSSSSITSSNYITRRDVCFGLLMLNSNAFEIPKCRGVHFVIVTELEDNLSGSSYEGSCLVQHDETMFSQKRLFEKTDLIASDYLRNVKRSAFPSAIKLSQIIFSRHNVKQVAERSRAILTTLSGQLFQNIMVPPQSALSLLGSRTLEIQRRFLLIGSRASTSLSHIARRLKPKN